MSRIFAPWTEAQIDNLNKYQSSQYMHPYTCGNGNCRNDLVATKEGWTCPCCSYTQNWALDFMVDGSWRKAENEVINLLLRNEQRAKLKKNER